MADEELLEQPIPEMVDPDQAIKAEGPEENDEDLDQLIVDIGEDFDEDDRQFRENQLIELKKNTLYWDGAQRLFWDSNAGTWIDANGLHTPAQKGKYGDDLTGASDRVINIYRPHGESIIAAMSVGTPIVEFFPEDADNANDITTAKAYSKIAELLQKRHDANLLFVKALYTFYNQGIVFAYNYTHKDGRYGTYEKTTETTERQVIQTPNPLTGEMVDVEEFIPKVTVSKDDKVSECMEIYGALHVEVPSWCRKPEDVPILSLRFESHESVIRKAYPDSYDKIRGGFSSADENQERIARLKPASDSEDKLCTLTCRWIKPTAYYTLNQEDAEKLEAKYPKGIKVVLLGKEILEKTEEALDDHWTICYPIFSETIHQKPQGSNVVDIQEIRNDVITNADETFRAAIPETFVDPAVLDFEAYQNTPRRPGQRFPTKPSSGKRISDGFHSEKPASLSQELDIFIRRLDADAQFSSGAFPSIFGGPSTAGSKTAAEYEQSRNQALQRLSTYWRMLSYFWVQAWGKATVQHARNLKELKYDEKNVVKNGNTFQNIFIKWAELEGQVGKVQPEANENFPISSAAKKTLIVSMLQLKNPVIERLMYHPENAQLILEIIGMPDLYLPGADDRTKQIREIGEILKGAAVEIDFDADDHEVQEQICRAWMISDIGQYEKSHNPQGYLAVGEHLKMHKMAKMQQTMQEAPTGQPPPSNAAGPV